MSLLLIRSSVAVEPATAAAACCCCISSSSTSSPSSSAHRRRISSAASSTRPRGTSCDSTPVNKARRRPFSLWQSFSRSGMGSIASTAPSSAVTADVASNMPMSFLTPSFQPPTSPIQASPASHGLLQGSASIALDRPTSINTPTRKLYTPSSRPSIPAGNAYELDDITLSSPRARFSTEASSSDTSSTSYNPGNHRSDSGYDTQPDSGGNAKRSDQINTLLLHPALYDPIRQPRNPIVLCHGLYGFDTWGLETFPALRIHYWADVLSVMQGIVGIDPIITSVPGTGSIYERAERLHRSLKETVKGKEVNLVAHSMGGLDCRHLLTHIQPSEYRALSLTTLATPHRGSHFMAWCRANIGIGDLAKAAAAAKKTGEFKPSSAAIAKAATSPEAQEDADLPIESPSTLPYSLKSPLFTRQQQAERDANDQAAKDAKASGNRQHSASEVSGLVSTIASATEAAASAASKVVAAAGVRATLGTSVASYLLDLLDSPAYSNLTPDFLAKHFNPNTPNMSSTKYFSVAARTPKLPVTHPLWLPKLILDKTEEVEKAAFQDRLRKEEEERQSKPYQPSTPAITSKTITWGNDGLVPVYSAKWGEFLGVLENTDHWSLRGGSGLNPAAKGKKKISASSNNASQPQRAPEPSEVVTSEKKDSSTDFGWQDVVSEVGSRIAQRDTFGAWGSMGDPDYKSATRDAKRNLTDTANNSSSNSQALTTLTSIAGWIARRVPFVSTSSGKQTKAEQSLRSSINPSFPIDDAAHGGEQIDARAGSVNTASSGSDSTLSDNSRLLFGLSSSGSNGNSADNNAKKPEKFNHERFYVALCRKLYDEGF